MEYFINLDKELFLWINHGLHNDFLNIIFTFITNRWNAIIPILLLIIYLIYNEKKKSIYLILGLAITIGIADQLSSGVIKPLVGRLRPSKALSDVFYWSKSRGWLITDDTHRYKSSFSFVSGHATNPFALATFMFFYNKKFIYFLLPLACMIAFSRIYIGVHYPADIIGGAMVGIFCGFLGKYLMEQIKIFVSFKAKKRNYNENK